VSSEEVALSVDWVVVVACAVVVVSAAIDPSQATTPHASANAATVPAITR